MALIDPDNFSARLESRVDRYESAHPDVVALAADHNFSVQHTGGGCLAYEFYADGGGYVWITDVDGVSLPESVDAPIALGLYGGDGGGIICDTTMREACSVLWAAVEGARLVGFPVDTSDMIRPLAALLEAAVAASLVDEDEAAAVAAILSR